MNLPRRSEAPLSPVMLAGLLAAPLPPFLLQPGLTYALGILRRRHPDLFDRLSSLDDPSYLIDPVDLPLVFRLSLDPERPELTAFRRASEVTAAATIRGPLMDLLDLLQGRVDGDALFFSRALTIEGDTGAIVALRNAMESVEVDLLDDLTSIFGPFRGPARRAIRLGNSLFERASRDLSALRNAASPRSRGNGPVGDPHPRGDGP
jgi:predicted lipid carrier protein YhbT